MSAREVAAYEAAAAATAVTVTVKFIGHERWCGPIVIAVCGWHVGRAATTLKCRLLQASSEKFARAKVLQHKILLPPRAVLAEL